MPGRGNKSNAHGEDRITSLTRYTVRGRGAKLSLYQIRVNLSRSTSDHVTWEKTMLFVILMLFTRGKFYWLTRKKTCVILKQVFFFAKISQKVVPKLGPTWHIYYLLKRFYRGHFLSTLKICEKSPRLSGRVHPHISHPQKWIIFRTDGRTDGRTNTIRFEALPT